MVEIFPESHVVFVVESWNVVTRLKLFVRITIHLNYFKCCRVNNLSLFFFILFLSYFKQHIFSIKLHEYGYSNKHRSPLLLLRSNLSSSRVNSAPARNPGLCSLGIFLCVRMTHRLYKLQPIQIKKNVPSFEDFSSMSNVATRWHKSRRLTSYFWTAAAWITTGRNDF